MTPIAANEACSLGRWARGRERARTSEVSRSSGLKAEVLRHVRPLGALAGSRDRHRTTRDGEPALGSRPATAGAGRGASPGGRGPGFP
eukprot:6223717-Pyramimonas_sp.AAC.1